MSFIDKRNIRSARQSKSYVSQSRSPASVDRPVSISGVVEPDHLRREQTHHDEDDSDGSTIKAVNTLVLTNDSLKRADGVEKVAANGLYRSLLVCAEIRKTKKAGRGLWAVQTIKAGSIILSLTPHVHVLSSGNLDKYCSACCRPRQAPPASGLKRCTKCRVIWYCSQKCQSRDWSAHKAECEALRRWMASAPPSTSTSEDSESNISAVPSDAIRALGRILQRRRKEMESDGRESVWWREIAAMQSHRNSSPPKTAESQVHLAHALVRYLSVSGPEELSQFGIGSAGDLVDMISKFSTNAFTLSTPSITPIGTSISPLAALINHNCDPNAVIVFPRNDFTSATSESLEPVLQVIAIKDILPETEILTSYVDTTLPTQLRQNDLKETYNFTCECRLCVPPLTKVDWREAIWCPKACGGICSFPINDNNKLKCPKCSSQMPMLMENITALQDVLRLGQDALTKASALQITDPHYALRITSNVIPLLTTSSKSVFQDDSNIQLKLTPSTHPLLAINRLHQSLLIASLPSPPTKETLDESIRIAAASVAGLSNLLINGHPVNSIALAELGKLLAVDEPPSDKVGSTATTTTSLFPPTGASRLKLAKETLRKAYDAALIGFGRANGGGDVGRDVHELLANVDKELSIWEKRLGDVVRYG